MHRLGPGLYESRQGQAIMRWILLGLACALFAFVAILTAVYHGVPA